MEHIEDIQLFLWVHQVRRDIINSNAKYAWKLDLGNMQKVLSLASTEMKLAYADRAVHLGDPIFGNLYKC